MKSYKFLFFSVLLIFLTACQNDSKQNFKSESDTYGETVYRTDTYDEPLDLTDITDNEKVDQQDDDGIVSDDEIKKIGKKIIKNADIEIDVKDYDSTIKYIKSSLKNFECYIAQETENSYTDYISNQLVIRVKSSQFDSLLNVILSGDGNVTYKSIYVNDITADYIDLYARLKTKKEVEAQYKEILKNAKTTTEILAVTDYLNRIREEIEATQGKLKYWDKQVAYSTINLTINCNYYTPVKNKFSKQLINGIKAGWEGLKYAILAIFTLWPLWIFVVIIIFAVRRKRKRTSKHDKHSQI